MKRVIISSAILCALAIPAFADGDAKKGEREFNKCKACHEIASADETFVKGGRTGPNLYGIIGRQAGTNEDFSSYGDSIVEAGAAGLIWTEEELAEYVKDPKGYLSEKLDGSATSKMTFRLKKGGEDVAAFLATFSDADAATDDGEEKSDS